MSVVETWRALERRQDNLDRETHAESQAYEDLLGLHDGPIPSCRVDDDAEVVFENPERHGVHTIIWFRNGSWHHGDVERLPEATGTIMDARILAEQLHDLWPQASQYTHPRDSAAWDSTMRKQAPAAEEALRTFVREHGDTLRGPEHKVRAVRRWLKGSQENIRRLVDDLLLDPASGR